MAVEITLDDLAAFAGEVPPGKARMLIDGAIATAMLEAPCLGNVSPDSPQALAAKMVLLAIIARWAAGGSSQGVQQQSVDVFSVQYAPFTGTFSDQDIRRLKAICGPTGGRAFAVDTAPGLVPGIAAPGRGEQTDVWADMGYPEWCDFLADLDPSCMEAASG